MPDIEVERDVESNGSGGDVDVSDSVAVPTPGDSPNRVQDVASKLSIKGNGLSFEREIPDSLALRIMQLVITGDTEPLVRSAGVVDDRRAIDGGDRDNGGRKEALAEFYRRTGPKRYPEKLTTIAAYLQEVIGRRSFTSDDLRGQFRSVNEPLPGNLPRDFKVAVGEGWIAEEHDAPGSFFVTRSGLEAVETGFSTDAGRKSGGQRRRKRAARTPVSEAPEASE